MPLEDGQMSSLQFLVPVPGEDLREPLVVSSSDFLKEHGCYRFSFQLKFYIHPSLPTEGDQYLCSGEGMFRRPSEGQSLISYLSEQDFGSCADLEKVRHQRGR